MKPQLVHLKNQFPGSTFSSSENHVDVTDIDGNLRVSLRKNGAGQIYDAKDETGALEAFSLDPIPKNARVYKLYADGRVGLSEEAAERKLVAKKIAKAGKVLSIAEYKKAGVSLDAAGNVIELKSAPGNTRAAIDSF